MALNPNTINQYLFIDIFYSIQLFFLWTANVLIRLHGCAGSSRHLRNVQVTQWLVLLTSSRGPFFESCLMWNLAHYCTALYCSEPFIITLPASHYDLNKTPNLHHLGFSWHWLLMGKVEIVSYCCLTADTFTKVLQKYFLSCPLC